MPPVVPIIGLGRTAFLATFTPSTTTCSASMRCLTMPRLPLSLPLRTMTSSFLRILSMTHPLQNFRRERHDLHEALGTQFTRYRPEDAGTDRLQLVVQQDGGIAVELDQRAILAAHALGGTDDDSVVDFTLLDASARSGGLHGDLDHVAYARIATLGTAQHLDAQDFTRT